VVTVLDTARIQPALANAHRVTAHFQGITGDAGDDSFTFGDLKAQRVMLAKVCPLGIGR
jgi:hypothetical protein